jgi:exonuclease III
MAIQIDAKTTSICLINVYLPSRGRKNTIQSYNEALDTLREVMMKYKDTHIVIIGGDMNGSIYRAPPNENDRALRKLIE